ncbi:MAG: hypothetical protein WBV94_09015 [Blastocatellia bacterium]
MSNIDRGLGLVPLYTLHGGAPSIMKLTKDAAQATAVFRGDVVAREADSFIAPGGTPGTTTYDGVSLDYGPVSTLTDHLVVVDPYCIFEAQDDGDGLVVADEGQNVNFVFSAGSALTLNSGHKLDGSTHNTTNILDAKILRLIPRQNNDPGALASFEVLINKHRRTLGIAGI